MIISSYTLSLLIASVIILTTSLPVDRCRTTRLSLEAKNHVILFLKTNSDRYDKPIRDSQSFKTGTHTYASWKSPNQRSDQRIEDFDFDYEKNDREYTEEVDETEEEYDDYEDDEDNSSEEAPSTVLTWARKLYDSVFFYGLDPAPAVQKSNKRKIMKDANGSDGRKNTSPFFTASEQRVQRYMSAMRNKEDSSSKDKNDNQKEDNKSGFQKNVSKGKQSSNIERDSTRRDNDKYRKDQEDRQQFDIKPIKSMEAMIEDLEERLVDMTLELELIEAEILTSSAETNREFDNLLRKRDLLLDLIEDYEIELVTKKSAL
jgi:hypothetical protein